MCINQSGLKTQQECGDGMSAVISFMHTYIFIYVHTYVHITYMYIFKYVCTYIQYGSIFNLKCVSDFNGEILGAITLVKGILRLNQYEGP